MRRILFAIFALIGLSAAGQLTVSEPTITYVGAWNYADLTDLSVGTKILFQQDCVPSIPRDVPNGTVYFANVMHGKQRFAMAVEFKDTIVQSVSYYLSRKQEDLLPAFGFLKVDAYQTPRKGEWTYMHKGDDRFDVIVGNRKSITVITRREK